MKKVVKQRVLASCHKQEDENEGIQRKLCVYVGKGEKKKRRLPQRPTLLNVRRYIVRHTVSSENTHDGKPHTQQKKEDQTTPSRGKKAALWGFSST